MMRIPLFVLLAAIFACLIPTLSAQNTNSEKIAAAITQRQQDFPREKVYLHLDKNLFVAGEDIRLKAYLLDGKTHTASVLSKLVYVELLNPGGQKLDRIYLDTKAGQAEGNLSIPGDVGAGQYQIRAWTNWMRNREEQFQMAVRVVSKNNPVQANATRSSKPDVQFMPEGGHLVAGLENQLAFKAIGSNGRGIEVAGQILDQNGRKVADFSTEMLGMGKLPFVPQANAADQARSNWEGQSFSYTLPKVQQEGIQLQVSPTPMFQQIRVEASEGRANSVISLVCMVREQVVFRLSGRLKGKVFETNMPNYKIPSGVMVMSLFDEKGRPLSERLVYVEQNDGLNVFVKADKSAFTDRKKVKLEITTTNGDGQPTPANLSLAVVDNRSLWDSPDWRSIKADLMLASELRGQLEQADRYFNPDNEKRFAELDLVMRTHGWRAWNWEEVVAGETPKIKHLIEQGITVSGQAFKKKNKVLPQASMAFMVDNYQNVVQVQANDAGRFLFNGMSFNDTALTIIQAKTATDKVKPAIIELDSFLTPKVIPQTQFGWQARREDAELAEEGVRQYELRRLINGDGTEYQADEVEITGERSRVEDLPPEGALYSSADQTLMYTDIPPSLNVFEAIRNRFPGITISGGTAMGTPYSILVRGINTLRGNTEPLYLLDGIPTDADVMTTVNMNDVKRIDFVKGPKGAAYGIRGANGVLAVYTKDGTEDEDPDELAKRGIIKPDLQGYHIRKEFYSPNYAISDPRHDLPDLRTTLHWEPMIRTNEWGKAEVSFYTGDNEGSFQILLQGITKEGSAGSGKGMIEVRK
ncbi:MAG: TonB-dependent receptor plug domain-containing protein [Bacteroidota bacterium]